MMKAQPALAEEFKRTRVGRKIQEGPTARLAWFYSENSFVDARGCSIPLESSGDGTIEMECEKST